MCLGSIWLSSAVCAAVREMIVSPFSCQEEAGSSLNCASVFEERMVADEKKKKPKGGWP